ncbi:unnamed protein product, partial [Rotaria sp. Silwood1]
MNNNATFPSVSFHRKTFGQNILINDNAFKATRHTSFDNDITFTNKRININERIYMKIIDIDQTGQWLGFTQFDRDSIQRHQLCKSVLANLCQKTGISYVDDIGDQLRSMASTIDEYKAIGLS